MPGQWWTRDLKRQPFAVFTYTSSYPPHEYALAGWAAVSFAVGFSEADNQEIAFAAGTFLRRSDHMVGNNGPCRIYRGPFLDRRSRPFLRRQPQPIARVP